MSAVAVIVTIVCALLFGFAGSGKVAGQSTSLEMRDHFGLSAERWRQIGLLEVAGAVGVLIGIAWRPLGVLAAVGLVLVGIGAIATHLRAGDKAPMLAPAVVAFALALVTLILQASS